MNSAFFVIDNKLKLNMEYILFHKPFRTIFYKYQDKNRDLIEGIFMYIYEIADARSHSNKNAFSKDKAHTQGLKIGSLPESFKVTSDIQAAIDYYKNTYYNVEADLLKELRSTLYIFMDTNKQIKKSVANKINSDKITDDSLIQVLTLQERLFKVISELPSKIESIKLLESKVNEQTLKSDITGRGGKVIPSSYEGDPEIEGEL